MNLLLAAFCGVASIVLMAAVLSPRFDDGIIGKAGCILSCLGFGAAALQLLEDGSVGRPLVMAMLGLALALFAPALRPLLSPTRRRHRRRESRL